MSDGEKPQNPKMFGFSVNHSQSATYVNMFTLSGSHLFHNMNDKNLKDPVF